MKMSRIEITELTKEYGDKLALNNVNLTIQENKIYGLLGRNGAGKTTLLKLLTNKIFPSSGDITIDGDSVFESNLSLSKVQYMMEENLYPKGLKVKEIYKWTKEFYSSFDMEYANILSKKFELNVNKKVRELSTGYTTIFKAIIALSSNANILLLDEPVLGLDANHRDLFYKELITNYNDSPKTIIISTHLIEEVANILEEVIIIEDGIILFNKSAEDLLSSAHKISGETENIDTFLKDKSYIEQESIGNFKSVIILDDSYKEKLSLPKKLNLKSSKIKLQELFISLTKS